MFKDLFSNFDYSSFNNIFLVSLSKMIWILGVCWMCFFFNSFFFNKKKYYVLQSSMFNFFYTKKSSEGFSLMKGFFSIFFCSFMLILGTKFWGLVPYIFSKTSQMLFVQSLAVSIWFSMMMSSLLKNMLSFWYIFFPSSPGFMLPFLNLIELVSFFMRSLTLTLRLSMKITTGHMFVSLLGSMMLFLLNSSVLLACLGGVIVLMSCGMFLFESCMSMIQALVFSLLLTSYFGEHTTH